MRAKGIRMYKHTMSCVISNELMCASQGYPLYTKHTLILVRAKGIEPSSKAWEAFVLPLYHARIMIQILYYIKTKVYKNKKPTIWSAFQSYFVCCFSFKTRSRYARYVPFGVFSIKLSICSSPIKPLLYAISSIQAILIP